jgi:hypothetical protein
MGRAPGLGDHVTVSETLKPEARRERVGTTVERKTGWRVRIKTQIE